MESSTQIPSRPSLLPLRQVPILSVPHLQGAIQIHTDHDVTLWKRTRGYHDYLLFLRRLCDAVVGHELPWKPYNLTPAAARLVGLLNELDAWIDDIPPQESPQRFGNLAFRTWGKRLEERCDSLLQNLLPSEYHPAIIHTKPYFLTSFGSFTRMDYGTGHETSFALFLLCLSLIRFIPLPLEDSTLNDPIQPPCPPTEVEREVVLVVFLRYMELCWKLQDVYRLEPAGSHGVWGLDDYTFLGYIFGSAQLRDQTLIPPTSILSPPSKPLPTTNLYFLCINRINAVKRGPFHEHSSQLHAIAVGVKGWPKVNSGLFKMYEAEVLGKRVVVQHLTIGGLLEWDLDEVPVQPGETRMERERTGSTQALGSANMTPWADVPERMKFTDGVTAPWASSSSNSANRGATPTPTTAIRGSTGGWEGTTAPWNHKGTR